MQPLLKLFIATPACICPHRDVHTGTSLLIQSAQPTVFIRQVAVRSSDQPSSVTRRRQSKPSNTQESKQRSTQPEAKTTTIEKQCKPNSTRYTLVKAHTPVTAKPRVRPSPPLNSPPALMAPRLPLPPLPQPPPPPPPPQCATDRKTYASEASHPHCTPANTIRVAVLADGLLPPGRSPRRHSHH